MLNYINDILLVEYKDDSSGNIKLTKANNKKVLKLLLEYIDWQKEQNDYYLESNIGGFKNYGRFYFKYLEDIKKKVEDKINEK